MTATVPARADVPVELTWDLESIYPTDERWERDFTLVGQRLPDLAARAGTLGRAATDLYTALRARDDASEILERLIVYANMRFHEDTTRAQYQALTDRVMGLATEFAAATAFYIPEILTIPQEQLDAFAQAEPALALYRHQLDEITRARPHVRSAEVEQAIASLAEVFQAPDRVFDMISYADLRLPTVPDGQGGEQQLSLGNYLVFMRHPDRAARAAAFTGMHETYQRQQNTIASNFSTQVKKNIALARVHHYPTAIAAALDGNNIPVSVYDTLVTTVEANLAPLHRYLKLRERVLNFDGGQHMYDLYTPLVADAEQTIPFDEARATVAQALAPLGDHYTAVLSQGMRSRWIDVLETSHKRGGAYSWGAYGTHPFILLNYQSQLDDMFTLAHEMGHSMHSHFTWTEQPYPYANYTIFLAEIASTLNEALLTRHLLATTEDKKVRATVLNHYIDGFRATLYRQTMFASFERLVHAQAEAGAALTPELLCGLYKDLNDRHYGAGGVQVDDLIAWEWSRIPHFYSSFYVYQYATGIAASTALAKMIREEGQPAVNRYLGMLRSGSSDYSIELLRQAGVDMTTPLPIAAAIAEFDRAVSELETLL